jgi:hypothetical protein
MRRLQAFYEKRNSNGAKGLWPNLFWKGIQTYTRHFHGVANGRHPNKLIPSLIQDEGHEQLKTYAVKYYKNLFGDPKEGNFSMDES